LSATRLLDKKMNIVNNDELTQIKIIQLFFTKT